MFNTVSNVGTVNVFDSFRNRNLATTQNYNAIASSYRTDSFSFNNSSVPTNPYDNPYDQPRSSITDRPLFRISAALAGTGLVGTGIGYAIGSAVGRAGVGAAIGAGVGVLGPVAFTLGYLLIKGIHY